MIRSLLSKGLLLLVLAVFYAASYSTLLDHGLDHPVDDAQRTSFWSLPPFVLEALAGEFKGLMADLMVLEAGAQVGTEVVRTPDGNFEVVVEERDWQAIARLLKGSLALDPSFQQTYILAQGWLPWEGVGMIEETNEMLKIAAKNRPWDWRPLHSIGFNSYYFLKQPGEAGKLFLEASKTPDAPPFLAILGSRLAQKGGETEAAIGLMKTMLVTKDESDPGYQDMVDRLYALEGVLILERAVQQYEREYAKKPDDLADLTASGILVSLPPNPYGLPYCLDEEGVLHFDKPECRRSAPPSPAPSSS